MFHLPKLYATIRAYRFYLSNLYAPIRSRVSFYKTVLFTDANSMLVFENLVLEIGVGIGALILSLLEK